MQFTGPLATPHACKNHQNLFSFIFLNIFCKHAEIRASTHYRIYIHRRENLWISYYCSFVLLLMRLGLISDQYFQVGMKS